MNKCLFFGRLTKDPEVFTTQNGNKLVRITIAMDRKVKDEKRAQFIPCIAFNKNAELRVENATGKTKDGVEYPKFRFVVERFWFAGTKKEQQHEQAAEAPAVEPEVPEDELEKELEEIFEEDPAFVPPVKNGAITSETELPF